MAYMRSNRQNQSEFGLGIAPVIIGAAIGGLGKLFGGGNNTAKAKASRVPELNALAAQVQAGSVNAWHALGVRAGVLSPVTDPAFTDGMGGGGKKSGPLTAGRASDWVGRNDRPWALAQQLYDQLRPVVTVAMNRATSTAPSAGGVQLPLSVASPGGVPVLPVALIGGAALLLLALRRK